MSRIAFTGLGNMGSGTAANLALIDCSTIDVASARAVIAEAREQQLAMVDAPVSGGIAAANAGTLTFMTGGEATAFERARPILKQTGKTVIHDGAAGAGQAANGTRTILG